LAAIGYLVKGSWKTDHFEHWLVLSLIVAAESHLVYMLCARLFDAPYVVAMLLKIAEYIFVLTGLFISNVFSFSEVEAHTLRICCGDQSLAKEIGVRHRRKTSCGQAQDELGTRVPARTADLPRP